MLRSACAKLNAVRFSACSEDRLSSLERIGGSLKRVGREAQSRPTRTTASLSGAATCYFRKLPSLCRLDIDSPNWAGDPGAWSVRQTPLMPSAHERGWIRKQR
jgi:hypothetical protein